MQRLKISLMASLLGALAFTAAAHAAEPQPATANDARIAAQDEAKKADASDAYCLRQTGTRIARRAETRDARADGKKSRSCGAIGRAYTRADMDRTGEINIADALRKLDPSIH